MDLNLLQKVDIAKAENKIDKGLFIIFYNKNKIYLLPIAVLLISIIMFFYVIVPQFKQYLAQKEKLDIETQKLQVLKNSFNYLTSLDSIQVESDLKLLTKALPIEKDVMGIMTAISAVSSKTGMGIDSYRFAPGNLSKIIKEETAIFPSIIMELKLEGNGNVFKNFLTELYRTVPILDVLDIKYKGNTGVLILAFYYKPLPPENISDDKIVNKLSNKDKKLIKDFYFWNNLQVSNGLLVSDGIASNSSIIEFSYISSESALFNIPQASSGAFYPF